MPAPAAYDPNKQFDVARRRAAEAERANLQQSKDALARRAAQLGGGPGGALIKAEQGAEDASAKRLASANEGIDAAQGAEMGRRQEILEARQFQTSERLGSQKFASGERAAQQNFAAAQSEAQRKWQSGERLSAQDWQALQAKDARAWQTSEREASQAYGTAERQAAQLWQGRQTRYNREDQQKFQLQLQEFQQSQFAQQMSLALEQFAHEKEVDAFNMELSRDIFEEKDLLERLLMPPGGGGGGMGNWFQGGGLTGNRGGWGLSLPTPGGGGTGSWIA